MANLFNCFPLTVFRDRLGLSGEYRSQLKDRIIEIRSANPADKLEMHSWTGDLNGYDLFHLEPISERFFSSVAPCVDNYLLALGLDPEKFRLHCTRSWGTVSYKNEHIPVHNHNQAHISIVYYPSKPPDSGNIVFHCSNPQNEFSPGIFSSHAVENGYFAELTTFNTKSATTEISEDEIVVFPSKTPHASEPNNSDLPRVSIAADLLVTLKGPSRGEYSIPDVRNWRTLDGFS